MVVFLNGISALQILQMATFLLATGLSSFPGKPNCPHTTCTLFKVLIGKKQGCHFLYFATTCLAHHNEGSHIPRFHFRFTQCISLHNIPMCCTACIAGVLCCSVLPLCTDILSQQLITSWQLYNNIYCVEPNLAKVINSNLYFLSSCQMQTSDGHSGLQ